MDNNNIEIGQEGAEQPVNTDIYQQADIIAAMPPPQFNIVAIGASAGGLTALTQLLLNLSPNLGAAYVIIQHLLPGHESILPELLNKKTEMPVHTVENGMKIEPDNVYVIPPNVYMSILDGHLTLGPRQNNNGNHSIDYFYEALAYAYKTKAVAVILSGTGSDGTEGISYIKAEGGITFAQDNSAAFQGMPQSAVQSGFTDFVLPANEIGEMLEKILKTFSSNKTELDLISENEDALNKIHAMLLQKRGVDFKLYKQNTIHRRILRRMKLNRLENLQSFTQLLQDEPEEINLLYKDLLINVTSFFREPAVYDALSHSIFPALLRNRKHNDPVRMWIPACSSGEEPYSIAICLFEYLKGKAISTPVQIYATDLSEQAIDKARAGIYHHSTLQNISADRLKKYFIKLDGSYQIVKAVRDVCVFANHNLLKDPPFSRMDIISCQNVMIYLDSAPQRRILMSFNYALKPTGFLLLGKSETISSAAELFEPMNKDSKVYIKKTPPPNTYFNFSVFSGNAPGDTELKRSNDFSPLQKTEVDVEKEADKLLLAQYIPASVLVNKDLQILRFYGATFPFLQPSSGKASLHLLKMVREELLYDVRGLLLNVRQNGRSAKKENIELLIGGELQIISLEAVFVKSPDADKCMLIIFAPQPAKLPANAAPEANAPGARKGVKDKRIQVLENELSEAKEYIKSLSEEFEAAKEELQSANEEILSSIEELQSINEELETSKEELQSANEELTTVNEELQLRNNDLKELVDYTDSIVQTISQSLAVLHPDLRINTVNKAFLDLFNLQPEETEGSYLFEINNGLLNIAALRSGLENDHLQESVFYTFETDHVFSRLGRKILLMNAMRMRGGGKRARILLAMEDITERRKGEETKSWLAAIVSSSSEGIISFTKDLTLLSWNKGAEQIYGYTADEIIGKSLMLLMPPDKTAEPKMLLQQIEDNKIVKQYETVRINKSGALIPVELTISAIRNNDNQIAAYTGLVRDITQRKKREAETQRLLAQVQQENAQKMAILESIGDVFYALDEQFNFTYLNHKAEEAWNKKRQALIGKNFWEEFPALKGTESFSMHQQVMQTKEPVFYESFSLILHRWVNINIQPNESGGLAVYLQDIQDLHERREANNKLQQAAERFRAIVNQATACVTEVNHEGKFMFANQTFCNISGYTSDELMTMRVHNIVHPDSLEACMQAFDETIKTGKSFVIEKCIVCKNKAVVYLNESISSIRDEQNDARSIVAVAIDITDRKRSAEMLQQSEERYRIALEAGRLAAWDWNLTTNKIIWNEQHFILFGLAPHADEEQEPEDFLRHIHPEDINFVKKQLDIAIQETGVYEAEFRIIKADDKALRWMMGYGRVVERNENKAARITGVMYDVTEIKTANEDLKAAQASLNIALEASKMGVWDLDFKTGNTKRSPRHDKLLGYESLQPNWNNEKAKAHLIASDKARFDEAYDIMLATGKFDLEARVQHANGSTCWVHYFGNVFYDENNKPVQAAGVIYDITDRKTIDKQKDDFIGIASHELKTPVTTIKAYAEILYENFVNAEDQMNAGFLSKMNGQIDRLTHLIKDLLDVTKISEGKLLLNVTPTDINQLLQEVADDMQTANNRHTISIEQQALPLFKGDKERLRQVFVNLLSNAIKYSPDADKVIIKTNFADNKINITVQDFGMGMSANTQSKLFERFFRAGDANIATFPGLGLGLYISMEIVKQHKGTIHVESERGKGSVFTVELWAPQE